MRSDIQLTSCQSRRTPASPANMSPSATPISFRTRLSTWWLIHAIHPAPPIVDVSHAPGLSVRSVVCLTVTEVSCFNLQRIAVAGAPKNDHVLVPAEYFDIPSSNPESQQPNAATPVNSGKHGGFRLCCYS
jgi:hypothetical protein